MWTFWLAKTLANCQCGEFEFEKTVEHKDSFEHLENFPLFVYKFESQFSFVSETERIGLTKKLKIVQIQLIVVRSKAQLVLAF